MGMSGEPTASPDVKHFISHDLYTQVNSLPTDEEDPDTWSKSSFITMTPDEVYEDSIYKMKIIGRVVRYDSLKAKDRAVIGVQIEAYSKILQRTDTLIPLSILTRSTHSIRDFSPDLGLYLELRKINMEEGKFMFLKKQRAKSDMIFIKVHEKPLVNLVWIGTIITVLGMFMAMRQKNKNKKS
jgi:cytochrome c-type biogenesis protein CcmF